MKELRCILFTETELASALKTQRAARGEALPLSRSESVTVDSRTPYSATLHVIDRDARSRTFRFEAEELTAALVGHCLGLKIPMPMQADKRIEAFGRNIALMIEKPPRRRAA